MNSIIAIRLKKNMDMLNAKRVWGIICYHRKNVVPIVIVTVIYSRSSHAAAIG